MKKKKDRIFVLVIALIVANLSYQLIQAILVMIGGSWRNPWWGFLVFVDVIAIIGALWLLRNYRRKRKIETQNSRDEADKNLD